MEKVSLKKLTAEGDAGGQWPGMSVRGRRHHSVTVYWFPPCGTKEELRGWKGFLLRKKVVDVCGSIYRHFVHKTTLASCVFMKCQEHISSSLWGECGWIHQKLVTCMDWLKAASPPLSSSFPPTQINTCPRLCLGTGQKKWREKLLEDTIITDIRFVKTLARWLAGVFNFSSLPSSLMSDAS